MTPWNRALYAKLLVTELVEKMEPKGEWSASRPYRFTLGERAPSTHWIGGWVGPRAGLDAVEKRKFLTLPELEFQPLGRPARGQSLYRLRYPASRNNNRYYNWVDFD
jgi:hypothetical protein